jgi:endonuclease/exonuclease/phosphatase family metal-dependent hydrolase
MIEPRNLRKLEAISVIVFFFQALRVLFSMLFGIISDQIFEGPIDAWLIISNLLVIAALGAPVIVPRSKPAKWLTWFAILTTLTRISMTLPDPGVRFWGSLGGIAFGGMYIATLIATSRSSFLSGMIGAIVIDQLLRSMGNTIDVSLRPAWLPIQFIWSGFIVGVSLWLNRINAVDEGSDGDLGWLEAGSLGGFIFLESSLLAVPNAVARWSRTPYSTAAFLIMAVSVMFIIPSVRNRLQILGRVGLVRLLFAVILIVGLWVGYNLDGALSLAGLGLAQFTVLTLLITLFKSNISEAPASGRRAAWGMLILLVLNFINAFAFTYPYTISAMRGLGWVVYLGAGVIMSLAVVVRSTVETDRRAHQIGTAPALFIAVAAVLLTIWVTRSKPALPLPNTGTFRIATYNIHYGYDDVWHFNLEEMAQAIEEANVDIIALQEVDTGRITSFAVDDAYYLSRRLGMNEVYLPTVEHLTGIALLYRGPQVINNVRLLTSEQEQTGIIHTELSIAGQPMNAFGIWLGLSNENTIRQIDEALEFIGDRELAAFGGDFNAEPTSPEVEAILEAGFEDPFLLLGIDPAPLTSPAIDPESRIDYVWLRGLRPRRAWVSDSLASDHRMVIIEVELQP